MANIWKGALPSKSLLVADQLIFSTSSAGCILAAGLIGKATAAGQITLILVTYTISLSLVESICVHPLVITGREKYAEIQGWTVAVAIAALMAIIEFFALLIILRDMTLAVVLGLGVACGIVQSFYRSLALMRGQSKTAIKSDLSWVAVQAIVTGVLFSRHFETVDALAMGWAFGAAVSLISGLRKDVEIRGSVSLRDAGRFTKDNIHLSWDSSQGQLFAQLNFVIAGAFLGVAATGLWRSAYLLMSPLLLVTTSLRLLLLPRFSDTSGRSGESVDSLIRRSLRLIILLTIANSLVALPVVAQINRPDYGIPVFVGVLVAFELSLAACWSVYSMNLRSCGHAWKVLKLRTPVGIVQLISILLGAAIWGNLLLVAAIPIIANIFLLWVLARTNNSETSTIPAEGRSLQNNVKSL